MGPLGDLLQENDCMPVSQAPSLNDERSSLPRLHGWRGSRRRVAFAHLEVGVRERASDFDARRAPYQAGVPLLQLGIKCGGLASFLLQ